MFGVSARGARSRRCSMFGKPTPLRITQQQIKSCPSTMTSVQYLPNLIPHFPPSFFFDTFFPDLKWDTLGLSAHLGSVEASRDQRHIVEARQSSPRNRSPCDAGKSFICSNPILGEKQTVVSDNQCSNQSMLSEYRHPPTNHPH
jgi:hypothetical protein